MSEKIRFYFKRTLLSLIFLLTASTASAIQPSFINGTVSSAFNNSLIPGTSITATTGVTTYTTAGSFSLRVPPDIYSIIFSAPGYKSNFVSGLHAAPGQTETINVQLCPASTETGYIKGRVTSKIDGDPVNGAYVLCHLGGFAVTDENGRFLMSTPSGEAVLTVCAENFETDTTLKTLVPPVVTTTINASLKPAAEDEITITGSIRDRCSGDLVSEAELHSSNGRVTNIENGQFTVIAPSGETTLIATADGYQFNYGSIDTLPLSTANTLDLSMTPNRNSFGLIKGIITDAITGDPVDSAKLVTDTDEISFSDDNGKYWLSAPQCTATVTISATGYSSTVLPLSLLQGISLTLNIALAPLATITGTLRDSLDNHKIIGADADINTVPPLSANSDATGRYRISNIPPGSYDLVISHNCYAAETANVTVATGETLQRDFTLTPNATGALHGYVYDRFSGDPLPDTTVRANHGAVTTTDMSGYYHLTLPAECRTSVTYHADGYIGTTSFAVDILDNATTRLDIRLTYCPILLSLGLRSPEDFDLAMRDFFRRNRNRIVSDTNAFRNHVRAYYRNAFEISAILINNPDLRRGSADLLTDLYRLKTINNHPPGTETTDRLLNNSRDLIKRLLNKASSTRCKNDLKALLNDLQTPSKMIPLFQMIR